MQMRGVLRPPRKYLDKVLFNRESVHSLFLKGVLKFAKTYESRKWEVIEQDISGDNMMGLRKDLTVWKCGYHTIAFNKTIDSQWNLATCIAFR